MGRGRGVKRILGGEKTERWVGVTKRGVSGAGGDYISRHIGPVCCDFGQ